MVSSKPGIPPAPASSLTRSPFLADPKKIIHALDRLWDLKPFASADALKMTILRSLNQFD
jgi:hypothetical protein